MRYTCPDMINRNLQTGKISRIAKILSFTLILGGVIIISGCSSEPETVAEPPRPASASSSFSADSTGEITNSYKFGAEIIAGQFQRDLKSALTSAVHEVGPAKAIGFCKLNAPRIGTMNDSSGWSIRRVSDKYRNPDNRADSTELVLLEHFKDSVDFEPFISFWSAGDSTWTYHFYEPIRTDQFCLNCHGDIQTLAGGVYDALKKKYPGDHATGYKTGEIRGMFIIEGVWPKGETFASHLVDTVTATE